jgi:hypothetical protein
MGSNMGSRAAYSQTSSAHKYNSKSLVDSMIEANARYGDGAGGKNQYVSLVISSIVMGNALYGDGAAGGEIYEEKIDISNVI